MQRNNAGEMKSATNSAKTNPMRVAGAACIVIAGAFLVAGILFFGMTEESAANRDFIEYWAAGQQLVHSENPYDATGILTREREVGYAGDRPKISFSPPIAFFLALPLGFVGAKAGLILWTIALLAAISLANWIIWILNGRPPNRWHLLGYVFAPVLACQMAGQLGTFLLLGVVLFLLLHRTRPLLAGAALLPCALKPHLFLPFAIALVLWSLHRRVFRVLTGFVVVLTASCVVTLSFDPVVWSQYAAMMKSTGVLDGFVPTLSAALRVLVNPNARWVQFTPEACGCIWAVWYFGTRRTQWRWTENGLLLLLVSAACTPYAWFSDEAVLLPAVMFGVYRALDSGRSLLPIGVFAGVALIEVLSVVKMTSPFYLWTVPAWFAWYLYATGAKRTQAVPIPV